MSKRKAEESISNEEISKMDPEYAPTTRAYTCGYCGNRHPENRCHRKKSDEADR